ncbi:phosphoribosyltransferase-like protein [Pseudomonas sp. TE3911]
MDASQSDTIKLKEIIRKLCTTKIRNPLTMERVRTWLKQFKSPEEQTLALLILKNLIYRTTDQIESCLRQALKEAVLHFEPPSHDEVGYDWRRILTNVRPLRSGRFFFLAPPIGPASSPGKSGELIARLLHSKFGVERSYLTYCEDRKIPEDEYLLVVDDGSFTGSQISDIFTISGQLMRSHSRGAVILSIVHEDAIEKLNTDFPDVRVFYGELLTERDNFKNVCENWIGDGNWPYPDVHPYDLYISVAHRAGVGSNAEGFGKLGLLVVYEHGIPDNTLNLLWERSSSWEPLFER